ncbi:uncharacterized protein K452DRAFT_319375 [Aplosporella prunicola CBS 121167]|uniref:Uncharacterized protein n=1 Tax=Aplosporella prunicola CBS 121167 TaxID=1176127 RepID=A0A6A6BCX5_9PEZI|nr:uncharacterized protein K452DRAFT_319375 [Aplosporella prunicola CBS 121167]KAF2141145.1 hypothetical protein K452DRAFT_319375 [Aplosporella prunicola CBS 121167]
MATITRRSWRASSRNWQIELQGKMEFEIFSNLTQTDVSPEEALQQILARIKAVLNNKQELGQRLYDTASCLIEVAERTAAPERLNKLATFVKLLREITWTGENGEPLRHDDYLLFTDLPVFGYTLADELQSFSPDKSDGNTEDEQAWENLVTFCAQFSTPNKMFDLTDVYTCWDLRLAFDPEGPANECTVRSACLWFIYAADTLWAHVLDPKVEDGERPWFSRENWKWWKKWLKDFKSQFGAKESRRTRDLIDEALVQMKRVEKKS